MVYFRKRLTPEVLGEINEMIVRDAKERQVKEAESKDDDDDSDGQPGTGGNSGTMIVDATCAVQYPLSSGCFPAQRGQGEHRKAFGCSSRSRGRKEASNLP